MAIDCQGVVTKAISSHYYVACPNGQTYDCRLKGTLRMKNEIPVPGDRVSLISEDDAHGTVVEIAARRNRFERPAVANVDTLAIVVAQSQPEPDLLMIDRLTVFARYLEVEPVIIFNKCDRGSVDAWQRIYDKALLSTYAVSAVTGRGIDRLRDRLTGGGLVVFTGNSGVGKSSLLNALYGELHLTTGEVSQKLGRGRHTTRYTQLFPNGHGGFVADTPGFSALGTVRSYALKENLIDYFADFTPFLNDCGFPACTHTGERDCGLIRAAADGSLAPSRLASYRAILEELKDLTPWNEQKSKK